MGNHSNMARKVTLQHMERLVRAAAGDPLAPPPLLPNQIQLYSYYRPGLSAGNYAIEAEQNITATGHWGTESLQVYNRKKALPVHIPPMIEPQVFEVVAPQFSLDPKLIDSHYPPDGHQDEARILPHVVLNDPHFPWERRADIQIEDLQDPDRDLNGKLLDANGAVVAEVGKAAKRNAVPWVALMVFDSSELPALTSNDVHDLNLPSTVDLNRQSANGALQMTVQQYLNIHPPNRVNFEAGMAHDPAGLGGLKESQEKMTAIFPTKNKFKQLFPDISGLRYAAHVRNINTTGFPGAGIEELGLYSIIISSRMGNYSEPKPITQICHLVSVEHFETTKQNLQGGNDRIGLISLFSWTFTALPPNPINFVDSIKHVLKGMQMLRPKTDVLGSLAAQVQAASTPADAKALDSLRRRFSSGYTLARWRAETGEESAAFSRGPLVPQKVPPPVADWPTSSNTSKDYQILDTTTGIMDLSYSSAWQLGKTLSISDTTFNAALSRFRSAIQKWSESKTRSDLNAVPPKRALITGLLDNVNVIENLSSGDVSDPRRVTVPSNIGLAPPLTHPDVAPILGQNIATAVRTAGSAGDQIYNEFNLAGHNNTDWTLIHQWISEKLYLSDIPAHILIPDPSFLPEESLRFFRIDDIWLDCLIDGALSVGNHLERDVDRVREEIKQTYNAYLRDHTLPIPPQIPGYGLILRSQIVKVMPDLRITVKWQVGDQRMPYCRYIRPDDHTILGLLDRPPEELEAIELSQPPHQQRFSFGAAKTPSGFEFELRKLYTDGTDVAKWKAVENQPDQAKIASWLSSSPLDTKPRVVNLARMAKDVNQIVLSSSNSPPSNSHSYTDFVANSAELALELNDPSYYFRITPDPGTVSRTNTPRNRQLYCQKAIPPPTEDTAGNPLTNPADSESIGGAPPPKIPGGQTSLHPITREPPDKATNVIFKDTNPVPANPQAPLGTSQPLTNFNVQIYADYKGPPKIWTDDNAFDAANYVPTQNDYLYDLIFSVRKIPTRSKSDYRLREIIINLPHTGIKAPAEPLINAGSAAPRARILSNQRFVPFLNWTEAYLQVRLVPRSAEEHPVMVINNRRTREISFRLEEVDVAPTRTRSWVPIHNGNREHLGVVKVDVYERYETPGGVVSAAPAPVSVFLVKRDIRDDVHYD